MFCVLRAIRCVLGPFAGHYNSGPELKSHLRPERAAPASQVREHLPCSYVRLSYNVWHHYEHATTVCALSVMRLTGEPDAQHSFLAQVIAYAMFGSRTSYLVSGLVGLVALCWLAVSFPAEVVGKMDVACGLVLLGAALTLIVALRCS